MKLLDYERLQYFWEKIKEVFVSKAEGNNLYAPKSHTHAQSDITGLSDALAGKANGSHTHAIADITGLQSFVDERIGVVAGSVLDDINGEVI